MFERRKEGEFSKNRNKFAKKTLKNKEKTLFLDRSFKKGLKLAEKLKKSSETFKLAEKNEVSKFQLELFRQIFCFRKN